MLRGSVYKTQMLLREILLVFIIKWEASTLEQIWIPLVLKISLAMKSNTVWAGYFNLTLHESYVALKHTKGTLRRKTILSPGNLWFD